MKKETNILLCLDRLKHLNCGLGQVAKAMGETFLSLPKEEGIHVAFLLPMFGYAPFQKNVNYHKRTFANKFLSDTILKGYDIWHIPYQLSSDQLPKKAKIILTIHDLNFLYTKKSRRKRQYLRKVQRNCDRAHAIIFISHFTEQECRKHLKIPLSKPTRVIYNGIRQPLQETTRPKRLPEGKFLFSIGQFLVEKNFHALLPFIKLLPDDLNLVLAGECNTTYGRRVKSQIYQKKLQQRVILLGTVTEEEKAFLYSHCEAFVFPSIAEGFGLPILEAMLYEKNIFCSNKTSLPEIGKSFVFYWRSFDPEKMKEVYDEGMAEWTKDETRKKKQLAHAQTFVWENNVRQHLRFYQEVASLPKGSPVSFPKVSLIIVASRSDFIALILESILKQTLLPDEVVIGEDGENLEMKEMIADYQKDFPIPIKHTSQPDLGFRAGTARNKAVAASTGEVLIFSDGDLLFHPQFVEDYMKVLRPNMALIGTRTFLKRRISKKFVQQKTLPKRVTKFMIAGNFLNSIRLPLLRHLFGYYKDASRLRGGLVALYRPDYYAINGFDEDYNGWGREDTDFVCRLFFHGVHIQKLKHVALTYHLWHPKESRATLALNDQKLKETIRSQRTRCENGLSNHL